MKYKQFHKLIEEDTAEQKQAVYQKLQQDLALSDAPAPAEKRTGKWRNFFKIPARLAACLSAAVAVVCLTIVLPITLSKKEPDEQSYGTEAWIAIKIDYTLKEYAQKNNLPYLYIDWYDFADSRKTLQFVRSSNPDEIICVSEEFSNYSKAQSVCLYIVDKPIREEKFESYFDFCDNETLIRGIKVFWYTTTVADYVYFYHAYFEYGDYWYFIDFSSVYPIEPSLFDVIESMLP